MSTSSRAASRPRPKKSTKPAKPEPNALEGLVAAVHLLELGVVGLEKWSARRARLAAAHARQEAESQLRSAHLIDFPAVTRLVVPEPQRGITHLTPAGREKYEQALRQWAAEQTESELAWNLTCAHDPQFILGAVNEAFEESAVPSVCVDAGTEDDLGYLTLVITFPDSDVVLRDVAPKGAPAQRRTDQQIAEIYNDMVGSVVVATAKKAFAQAPTAAQVRIVVVRWDSGFLSRKQRLGVIYSGTVPRAVTTAEWSSLTPLEWIAGVPDARIDHSPKRPLRVLSPRKHPDLTELLTEVEHAAASAPASG